MQSAARDPGRTQSGMAPARGTEEPSTSPLFEGHKARVLLLLSLVYTFNYVDRQILIILAEPIKAEFGLKDWQLGFLTGTAFALFYATLGIPIARLADRWHRVNIVAISLAVWSTMTALCALTMNFVQLAAARIGVGVGEAGGTPPAVSVLSDYFNERQRATAMGIYQLGSTVGILIGFVAGGWVNQLYGWRVAMLVVGLPGILLALAVKLMVREPTRTVAAGADAILPFGPTIRTLVAIRTFRWVNLAAVAAGFTVYGVMVWTPVYFIREFGLTTGEVGTAIGLIAGIAGSAGVFLGGYLADAFAKVDRRWLARLPALTTLLFVPCVLLVVNAASAKAALILMVPTYILALAYTGPTWAVLQTVSPPQMRAIAAAILLLLVNLIGLGLGPQAIGILSDVMNGGTGTGGLRWGIGLAASVSVLASVFFLLASRSLQAEVGVPGGTPGGTP